MIGRIVHEFNSIVNKDKIILDYQHLPVLDKKVNLNYYHAELKYGNELFERNDNNLGDFLSKVVVEYLLQKEDISLNSDVNSTKHLYAIGSILLMGYQNAVVWGSGFPYEPSFLRSLFHRSTFRKLDVRCVRGPRTKKTLEKLGYNCKENYGDPAVLMPLIYNPTITKKTEYVVIPHYSMEDKYNGIIPNDNIVSMNTTDYRYVIDKIVSAKKVISSSLHGIILAESYGVPAVFLCDREQKFNYKYEDWYLSTGRTNYSLETDIKRAIEYINTTVPDLSKMQKTLIDTFPYDMWEV